MRIAPGSNVEIVWMMTDGKGNVTMKDSLLIGEQKIKNRKAFIKAYNKHVAGGNTPELKMSPEDILPGSSDEANQTAYKLYQNWADESANVDTTGAQYIKTPTKNSKMRWEMAKAAAAMREDSETRLGSLDTKKMVAMLKVAVLVDADGEIDIFDRAKKYSKSTGYGHNMVKDIATDGDMKYMTGVNKVDKWNMFTDWTRFGGLNVFSDNIYKMNVFMPVKDLATIAAKRGEQVGRLNDYNNIHNATNVAVNTATAITNPGNVQAVSKFIRE